ncbi:DUF2029 domain-containing protein [Candidatus Nomurabacteria bacterium]|nr:DUF2029 domain-containing protein [Candidatus Nomurabacteria bacterium]
MPAFFNDFFRYLWDGKMTVNGINPYLYFPFAVHETPELAHLSNVWYWDIMYFRWTHAIYPPVSQIVFAMAALVKQDSTLVLKSLFFLFNCGSIFLGNQLLKQFQKPKTFLLLVALCPLFLFETLASAHTEAIHVFFLLLTLWFVTKNKPVWSGISLGALALVKFFPLVYFPFLFLHFLSKQKNLRPPLLFSLAFAVTIVVLYYPFTLGVPSELLFESLSAFSQNWVLSPGLFDVIWTHLFNGTAQGYLLAKRTTTVITLLLWTLTFFVSARYAKQCHKHLEKNTCLALYAVTLILILFSSVIASWYILWILPFVLLIEKKWPVIIACVAFTLQYLLIYYDGEEHNTYKYLSNGDILGSQLFIWAPILLGLFWAYRKHFLSLWKKH